MILETVQRSCPFRFERCLSLIRFLRGQAKLE